MTKQDSVVAVFNSFDEATHAVEELERHGWDEAHASIVRRGHEAALDAAQPQLQNDVMEKTWAVGAATGATIGLLAGATLTFVPGLGPLVVAGALASGITGGIVGGLVGAMSGWGIKEPHARAYLDDLKAGKTLVVLRHEPAMLAEGRAILLASPAEQVAMHAESADSQVDA